MLDKFIMLNFVYLDFLLILVLVVGGMLAILIFGEEARDYLRRYTKYASIIIFVLCTYLMFWLLFVISYMFERMGGVKL